MPVYDIDFSFSHFYVFIILFTIPFRLKPL